jgi:LacI family transcriptional regulator
MENISLMDASVRATTKLQFIADKTGVTSQNVRDVILNNNVLIPDAAYRAIISALVDSSEGTYDCLVFRSDKMQRTPTRLTNDYIDNLIRSMSVALTESPYRLSYHVGNREVNSAGLYDSMLLKRPNSGLISITPSNVGLISEACQRHKTPCIFIDFHGDRTFGDEYVINIANRDSIKVAMRHLFDLGHRRIGFVAGMLTMTSALERLKGYEEALTEIGITYDPALVVEGSWVPDKAYEATLKLLQLPERPTAIVASNDVMASGVMIAIREAGLQIPGDISIIGFDDIPMAEDISLTTIQQPTKKIGMQAVQLMTALLDGETISQHEYEYPADLIVRQTTGRAH